MPYSLVSEKSPLRSSLVRQHSGSIIISVTVQPCVLLTELHPLRCLDFVAWQGVMSSQMCYQFLFGSDGNQMKPGISCVVDGSRERNQCDECLQSFMRLCEVSCWRETGCMWGQNLRLRLKTLDYLSSVVASFHLSAVLMSSPVGMNF
jgi:hypothetical protein